MIFNDEDSEVIHDLVKEAFKEGKKEVNYLGKLVGNIRILYTITDIVKVGEGETQKYRCCADMQTRRYDIKPKGKSKKKTRVIK